MMRLVNAAAAATQPLGRVYFSASTFLLAVAPADKTNSPNIPESPDEPQD